MSIDNELISRAVGKIGYQIIDGIVSPICGVSHVVADLYLAGISDYAENSRQEEEVIAAIVKQYDLPEDHYISPHWPVALIVLYILENGTY